MSCGAPSIESHARALARFEAHRRAWQGNAALRTLYADWYGRIRAKLPDRSLGPVIEIGSGPGLSAEFIDGLELSDVVAAPWLHRVFPAEAIPCEDGSVGALVLFDVLHHLAAPARFFGEASRVLRPGGRIVICEPHVGLLSYPVYRYLHEEPVVLSADPLADNDAGRDPFDGNQAIPTRLFCQERRVLEERFPALSLRSVDYFAGLAYPASGGFSHQPFLPLGLWKLLRSLEDGLLARWYRWFGFRLLAVIERRALDPAHTLAGAKR